MKLLLPIGVGSPSVGIIISSIDKIEIELRILSLVIGIIVGIISGFVMLYRFFKKDL